MIERPPPIPNLTPLRGIASVMVAIFHFNTITAHFVNQEQTMLLGKCYLMVDLFFILSGFIMLHVYGHEFDQMVIRKKFFKFTVARFARIYPLHFFTLLIMVGMIWYNNTPPSPIYDSNAILTNIFLLQSYGIHDNNTWNVPSWSISAEWFAYMLFPFLVFILFRLRDRGIILLSGISLMLYLGILYLFPRSDPFIPNLDVSYDYGYLRGLAGFIAGMITYVAFKKKIIADFFNNDTIPVLLTISVALLMHYDANDLWIILLFAALIFSIAVNKKRIYKIISQKPLQYLGDISYSIYLLQVPVLLFIMGNFIRELGFNYNGPGTLDVAFPQGLALCAIFLVVLIILATISYHVIEKPCRAWLNKKFKRHSIPVTTISA